MELIDVGQTPRATTGKNCSHEGAPKHAYAVNTISDQRYRYI